MPFLKSAVLLLLAAPIFGSDGTPSEPAGVRVHEWGTFTSVAGENGAPEAWTPLAEPSDLPCFVYHLAQKCIKCAPGFEPKSLPTVPTSTVRMETPVLYFYSAQPATVSVRVDFPRGWITEWYPQASKVLPQILEGQPMPALGGGHIEWNHVAISPATQSAAPVGQGSSRYYVARHTDAQPISVSGQAEKLIFYRGIADFPVPLSVKVLDASRLEIADTGNAVLPLVILFENRGGNLGYRAIREFSGTQVVNTPGFSGDQDGLKTHLAAALTDLGLYPQEAAAMIATWSDSWFEDGMRVFYLMPQRQVDAVLPIAIQPAPAETRRVFVGRVEVLSPFVRQTLTTALSTGDVKILAKYGRFLEPFATRIQGAETASPATAAFFRSRQEEARHEYEAPSCIR